ncbi:hypothetical protein BGX38DRAFT_1181819 [Terfezia claveryi]|nr:hypothetical protein BGX38DRAFT_1181819 [Terfezia claveryi]
MRRERKKGTILPLELLCYAKRSPSHHSCSRLMRDNNCGHRLKFTVELNSNVEGCRGNAEKRAGRSLQWYGMPLCQNYQKNSQNRRHSHHHSSQVQWTALMLEDGWRSTPYSIPTLITSPSSTLSTTLTPPHLKQLLYRLAGTTIFTVYETTPLLLYEIQLGIRSESVIRGTFSAPHYLNRVNPLGIPC